MFGIVWVNNLKECTLLSNPDKRWQFEVSSLYLYPLVMYIFLSWKITMYVSSLESSRPTLQPSISLSSAETLEQGNWKNCSFNTRRVARSPIQRCMFKSELICKYPSPLFFLHTLSPLWQLTPVWAEGGWAQKLFTSPHYSQPYLHFDLIASFLPLAEVDTFLCSVRNAIRPLSPSADPKTMDWPGLTSQRSNAKELESTEMHWGVTRALCHVFEASTRAAKHPDSMT